VVAALVAGCGERSTSPVKPPVDTSTVASTPPTRFTRGDLTPVGNVVNTADGYTVGLAPFRMCLSHSFANDVGSVEFQECATKYSVIGLSTNM
jgi:hypothetical protein